MSMASEFRIPYARLVGHKCLKVFEPPTFKKVHSTPMKNVTFT